MQGWFRACKSSLDHSRSQLRLCKWLGSDIQTQENLSFCSQNCRRAGREAEIRLWQGLVPAHSTTSGMEDRDGHGMGSAARATMQAAHQSQVAPVAAWPCLQVCVRARVHVCVLACLLGSERVCMRACICVAADCEQLAGYTRRNDSADRATTDQLMYSCEQLTGHAGMNHAAGARCTNAGDRPYQAHRQRRQSHHRPSDGQVENAQMRAGDWPHQAQRQSRQGHHRSSAGPSHLDNFGQAAQRRGLRSAAWLHLDRQGGQRVRSHQRRWCQSGRQDLQNQHPRLQGQGQVLPALVFEPWFEPSAALRPSTHCTAASRQARRPTSMAPPAWMAPAWPSRSTRPPSSSSRTGTGDLCLSPIFVDG